MPSAADTGIGNLARSNVRLHHKVHVLEEAVRDLRLTCIYAPHCRAGGRSWAMSDGPARPVLPDGQQGWCYDEHAQQDTVQANRNCADRFRPGHAVKLSTLRFLLVARRHGCSPHWSLARRHSLVSRSIK